MVPVAAIGCRASELERAAASQRILQFVRLRHPVLPPVVRLHVSDRAGGRAHDVRVRRGAEIVKVINLKGIC